MGNYFYSTDNTAQQMNQTSGNGETKITINEQNQNGNVNTENTQHCSDKHKNDLLTDMDKELSENSDKNDDEYSNSSNETDDESDSNQSKERSNVNLDKKWSINPQSALHISELKEMPYWKNTCAIDIDLVKYVWIYSSYYGNGWWFMTPEVNNHVEKLFKMWKNGEQIDDINHLKIHGGDFKYEFDTMCQINRITKTNRRICRLDIDELVLLEEKFINDLSQFDTLWMYQKGKHYLPFMPESQKTIEAAYKTYIENPNIPKNIHHEFKYPNGYTYAIDFENMTQRNQQTTVKKTIRRISNDQLKDGKFKLCNRLMRSDQLNDQSSPSTDESSPLTDSSNSSTDESSESNDQSNSLTDESSESNDQLSQSKTDQRLLNEQLNQSNDEPSELENQLSKTNDNQTSVNEQPNQSNDKPSESENQLSKTNDDQTSLNEQPNQLHDDTMRVNYQVSQIDDDQTSVNEQPNNQHLSVNIQLNESNNNVVLNDLDDQLVQPTLKSSCEMDNQSNNLLMPLDLLNQLVDQELKSICKTDNQTNNCQIPQDLVAQVVEQKLNFSSEIGNKCQDLPSSNMYQTTDFFVSNSINNFKD